jgi:hypothetical protein
MKNFSTVSARFAVAALFAGVLATPVHAAGAPERRSCEFKPNAPDQHVVVKGDTLWDISGKFLAHPWCWPQVWGLNKAEIKNPHWIYPGQIVYFDRATGRLSLNKPGSGSGMSGPNGTVRLSPQIRNEGLGSDAISSIPSELIEPFLTRPLIISANELAKAPRIVAGQEGKVFLGRDDKAYVRGDLNGISSFQVFRPGTPLKDPKTGAILAYEAIYLGSVKLHAEAKPGSDIHTFILASSVQEIGAGDQLVPQPPTALQNYMPHPPLETVEGNVAGVYSGVKYAGQNQVVSINRGALDGLDVGAVLQIYNLGRTVPDRTAKTDNFGRRPMIKLPDEESGTLFIFRVFPNVSYGLIMQSTQPVEVGDVVKSPE